MQQNKYSTPRHMSRSALPILYTNYFKSNWGDIFGIALILYLGLDDLSLIEKILYPMGFILLYLLGVALLTYLKYHFFKFYIDNGHLIVQKGIFRKQTLSIPTYKIHSLRTKSGFFYRLFDMKGISVDTLADKEKEVELILDDVDWKELLDMFKDEVQTVNIETSNDETLIEDKNTDRSFSYPNISLIKGALCQNHLKGTVIMAILLFNILLQLDDNIISTAADYAVEQSEKITLTATSVIICLIALYIVSLLFWIGKVLLRYYNMRLDISNDKLFFESGLITRRSVRFAHDKLSTLKIKANPLERMFKCSTVAMIQAFNVTDEKEKNDVLIYGCNICDKFLKWWFGKGYEQSEQIMDLHSGRGLFWYSIKYKLIAILAAIVILYILEQFIYIPFLGILLLFYIADACIIKHKSHIVLKDDYIEVHNGGFTDITYYLKYDNIENVRIRTTPFTPYTKRVHLIFSTNGSLFKVRSLMKDETIACYDIMLAKMYQNNK